jgi:uncharacterized phage protein (TIGR01671 family)
MREIRFKAILKGNKTFTAPFDWYDIKYMPEVDVIVQSTGLKDRNGVEIFEGDIVESENLYRSKVVYEDGAFIFKSLEKEIGVQRWVISHFEVEIISNIWENPELVHNPTQSLPA